jgi:hypothetical protein
MCCDDADVERALGLDPVSMPDGPHLALRVFGHVACISVFLVCTGLCVVGLLLASFYAVATFRDRAIGAMTAANVVVAVLLWCCCLLFCCVACENPNGAVGGSPGPTGFVLERLDIACGRQ